MQFLFTILIAMQFLLIVFHDILDIPGWTHGSQVKRTIGTGKFWVATLVNAVFPGVAVGLAITFLTRPPPAFARQYWVIYCLITVGSAVAMWWIPYFFDASEKTCTEYARMYAGTHHILPPRGENPRPNLLHLCFHVLFVVTFGLATVLWLVG